MQKPSSAMRSFASMGSMPGLLPGLKLGVDDGILTLVVITSLDATTRHELRVAVRVDQVHPVVPVPGLAQVVPQLVGTVDQRQAEVLRPVHQLEAVTPVVVDAGE